MFLLGVISDGPHLDVILGYGFLHPLIIASNKDPNRFSAKNWIIFGYVPENCKILPLIRHNRATIGQATDYISVV